MCCKLIVADLKIPRTKIVLIFDIRLFFIITICHNVSKILDFVVKIDRGLLFVRIYGKRLSMGIQAHKTFISYKYSEAKDLRDRIIKAMGENAIYYKGENGFSPNKSNDSDDAIWNYLKDMIWGTSVTIVIISPNMKQSSWIESEISYSLRKVTKGETQSQTNGIVAVIQKVNGTYDWFKYSIQHNDGHTTTNYRENLAFDIISQNRGNQVPKQYCCEYCKSIDPMSGSYISYVEEDEFLSHCNEYVEKAYDKSLNNHSGYEVKPNV